MDEVDRRTLLKAFAWSLPVVAAAVAAPLAAASTMPLDVTVLDVIPLGDHTLVQLSANNSESVPLLLTLLAPTTGELTIGPNSSTDGWSGPTVVPNGQEYSKQIAAQSTGTLIVFAYYYTSPPGTINFVASAPGHASIAIPAYLP